MASAGDLSNFFDEGKIDNQPLDLTEFYGSKIARAVWDGSWLEVDPRNYNKHQTLPDVQKSLNSVPQLEDLWDHTTSIHRYEGLPVLNFYEDSHRSLPTTQNKEASSEEMLELVGHIIYSFRRKVQLGNDLNDIFAEFNQHYPMEALEQAIPSINYLVEQEYGLLGNVYIDPSIFISSVAKPPKSCEEGARELRGVMNDAPYLKEMPECQGCVFNQNGSCAKFNKTIVSNLNYDPALINMFTQKLLTTGKIDSSHVDSIKNSENPEKALQLAFVHETPEEIKIGGVQGYPEWKELSKEEIDNAVDELKKTASNKAELEKALKHQRDLKPIWDFTSKQIQQGFTGKELGKRIASKFGVKTLKKFGKNLGSLLDEQGLLGNLYITSSPWNWNCKAAKGELTKTANARNAPFIGSTPNCSTCVHRNCNTCSLFNKTITANLSDLDITKLYPSIIENLYQAKRLTSTDKKQFLTKEASLGTIKDAFLHQKKEIKEGGVQNKPLPLKIHKTESYKLPTPITDFFKKEMHRGKSAEQIHNTIKQKFGAQEILQEKHALQEASEELGLLGNVYIDPDNYTDCKEGAKEANKKAKLAFVKVASKCSGCPFNKGGRCTSYKKDILGKVQNFGSSIKVASADIDWVKIAKEHLLWLQQNKKLGSKQISELARIKDIREMLRLAYTSKPQKEIRTGGVQVTPREEKQVIRDKKATVDLVKTSMLFHMNNGKYGSELAQILKQNFDQEALGWAKAEISKLASEDVVLGNVYVNPIFNGGDCHKQAEYIRKAAHVSNVQASSKCAGCVYNKAGKYCSLIKRPLVSEVNYTPELAKSYINLLNGNNRLDANYKVASNDPKKVIQSAFRYKKQKKVKVGGLKHTGEAPIRKEKLAVSKIAKNIETDLLSGVNIELIYRKYASQLPKFELDKIIASTIQKYTYDVSVVQEKEKPPVQLESDIDQFEVKSDFDVNVDTDSGGLDISDYLD